MIISTTGSYRAIPPLDSLDLENHYPGIHEAGVSDANPDTTREWTSSEGPVRWTYFLLGCASLLPWNALTNATPFFLSRLVDSPFYPTFSSYLLSVYTLIKLFCLSYCTIASRQSSTSHRIFVSIITTILLIASLCLSTFIQGTPLAFFSFGLFSAASLAITNGYLYAAVYALAALLGPSFLQSVLSGQAAIAVAISVVQVASAVISLWGLSPQAMHSMTPDNRDYDAEEVAARIFLGVSSLFLGITLVAYTWLTRQTSYKLVISAVKRQGDVENVDELAGLVTNGRRKALTYDISRVYRVFKQNWIIMVSIAYVFTVTLAVFPAITVRVRSVHQDIPPVLFTAVHFLVFSIGDLVGRLGHTSTRPSPRSCFLWSAKNIFVMSLVRTLFIPLILLCNVYRPGPATSPRVPPIINSDTLFMIILFTLGYTNGFVACIAMLALSSQSLSDRPNVDSNVDVAAALGGTFQIVGLASGALASFSVEATI